MKEKTFENKVKKFLKEENCWYVKYWGGAPFTKAGIPDILTCVNGYFVAIELKSEKGKPSELQKWTKEEIRKSNGISVILYPTDFEIFKIFITSLKSVELPKFPDTQTMFDREEYK